MSDIVTNLTAYRMLNEDEFELEEHREEEHPVLFTASEISSLERIGMHYANVGSPLAPMLLTKCLLWRQARKAGA